MAEETEKVSSSTSDQSFVHKQPEKTGLKPQAQGSSESGAYPHGDFPMNPVYYPALVHGLNPLQYDEQMMNRGAGIYAVPVHTFAGHVAGLASNNLIPLTYNLPTSGPSNEAETRGEGQGQDGQQRQQQQQQQQQQPAHHRRVIEWRFEIAFQLDFFLILKLAAVVFLFNHDGSRQRLAVLVFFATMIYLYQTGALRPFVRWLSRVMNRAAAAPRPQRHVVNGDNDLAAAVRPLIDDAVPEGQGREENGAENRANANEDENVVGPEAGGNQWWGIVKEIQMIVFGFITSLFPGFQNID